MKYVSRVRTLAVSTAAALTLFVSAPRPAQAQWAVIDPANLAQNILTAARSLQMTVQSATQIANQIQQIQQGIQNLASLPQALINQYLGQYIQTYQQLQNSWAQINSMAANLANLTVNYNNLFPNRAIAPGLTAPQMLAQTQAYVAQASQDIEGLGRMAGQVAAQLPVDQANLTQKVANLGATTGTVSAMHSMGSIQAQIATNVSQTNALLAAMANAQMVMYGKEVDDRAQAQAITTDMNRANTPNAAPALPFPLP